MNCPGVAARRSSIAGMLSISSVCSIITTASAPRGTTPPVAMVVAVPGFTSTRGAWPQAITSGLSAICFGAPSAAPAVSAARSAKPSTLARSNGGTSIGAARSAASTRLSAAASATGSAGRGARSRLRSKRLRASSADTTSRNCSCRAASRTAASSSLATRGTLGSFFRAMGAPPRGSRPDSPRCRPAPGSSPRRAPAPASTDNRPRPARPGRAGGAPR